jgi:sRNA-binding carbon storage regulator CsrA
MRMLDLTDGQSLQIGDITVTVLEVDQDEVLLRIECPEGLIVEAGNPALAMQSQRWLE